MSAKIYQFHEYKQRKIQEETPLSIPLWQTVGTALNMVCMLIVFGTFAYLCFNPPDGTSVLLSRTLSVFLFVFMLYHGVKTIIIYAEQSYIREADYMQSIVNFNSSIVMTLVLLWGIADDKTWSLYVGMFLGCGFLFFNLFLFMKWGETKEAITD